MTTVYRRTIDTYVDTPVWQRYEYGTLFDLLRKLNELDCWTFGHASAVGSLHSYSSMDASIKQKD